MGGGGEFWRKGLVESGLPINCQREGGGEGGGRENIAEPYEGIRKFPREITRIFHPSFPKAMSNDRSLSTGALQNLVNFFQGLHIKWCPILERAETLAGKITGDASIMH